MKYCLYANNWDKNGFSFIVNSSSFLKPLIVFKVEFKNSILFNDNFNNFKLVHLANGVMNDIWLFSAFNISKLGNDSLKDKSSILLSLIYNSFKFVKNLISYV